MCGGSNNLQKNDMSAAKPGKSADNMKADSANDSRAGSVNRPSGRRVAFNETVQVVLIPCIQEYREAGLYRSIWWDHQDLRGFQITMGIAFRKFLETTECDSLRDALRMFIADELTRDELCGPPLLSKRIVIETLASLEGVPSIKRIKA
jgi:hypothetical protein